MAGPVNPRYPETSRGQESSTGGVVGAVKDKAQEFASSVASRAEDAWDTARRQAQDAASTAASTAQDTWMTVSHFFGRYPIPMFFVGVGVGFLLARAFDLFPADIPSRMSRSSDWSGNR